MDANIALIRKNKHNKYQLLMFDFKTFTFNKTPFFSTKEILLLIFKYACLRQSVNIITQKERDFFILLSCNLENKWKINLDVAYSYKDALAILNSYPDQQLYPIEDLNLTSLPLSILSL